MTQHRVSEAEWKKGLYESFAKVRQHTEPYDIKVGKFDITVLPNVFSPKYFTDSLYFAEQLVDIVGNKSLLEIGTGTGIAALYCAAAGSRVTATDINPMAITNARLNIARHNLSVSIREGNLFEPVLANERFDFIFWNHPFNDWNDDVDMLACAGIDRCYGALRSYIRNAERFLSKNGRLLLGSSDMAHTGAIEEIAHEYGYKLTVLRQVDMPIEEGSEVWNTYLIYRLDPTLFCTPYAFDGSERV